MRFANVSLRIFIIRPSRAPLLRKICIGETSGSSECRCHRREGGSSAVNGVGGGGWEYGNSGIPGTTFITVLKVPWFFEGRFAVCEGHSWKLYLLDSRGKSEAVTDFYPPPLLFF